MQGETATDLHNKCNELKEELNEAKTALHEKDRKIDALRADGDQLRDKISIMDERLVARDKCVHSLDTCSYPTLRFSMMFGCARHPFSRCKNRVILPLNIGHQVRIVLRIRPS